jgi:MOSC domain-containing protein YiiM
MVRRFGEASRPGAYLRILREGELGAGDAIEVLSRPAHGVTVALVSDAILRDDSLRPVAAAAPELAVGLAKYLDDDQAA